MSEKKIDAKITLNGEKEFKSGVTSCNKALSTVNYPPPKGSGLVTAQS